MRIIGGKAKGRRLQVPKSGVRPTPDRVREALCSMLGPQIPDARILDLFAGTGAFGLECLSRGASSVTLVEKNTKNIRVLQDNIEKTQLGSPSVIHMPAARALKQLSSQNSKFDIAFLDPPFDAGLLEQSLHLLIELGLMETDGCAICEHRSQVSPPQSPAGWGQVLTRAYGDVTITVFRPDTQEEEQ